jgi:hypothetical protein
LLTTRTAQAIAQAAARTLVAPLLERFVNYTIAVIINTITGDFAFRDGLTPCIDVHIGRRCLHIGYSGCVKFIPYTGIKLDIGISTH